MADQPWVLENPFEALDRWVGQEHPSDDLQYLVTEWMFGLVEDPYGQGRREPDFDNLWFAVVPGSRNETGAMVTCSFWIDVAQRSVRPDSFATLNPPFV